MFITVLPKPDESYVCAAKIDELTPYGKFSALQSAQIFLVLNANIF